jgi:galactosylxylosylprotein 3-beta-galactosyltransferase
MALRVSLASAVLAIVIGFVLGRLSRSLSPAITTDSTAIDDDNRDAVPLDSIPLLPSSPLPSLLLSSSSSPSPSPVASTANVRSGSARRDVPSRVRLLVLVMSVPSHAEARQTARTTWMSLVSGDSSAVVRFVVPSGGLDEASAAALAAEVDKHADLLVVEDLAASPFEQLAEEPGSKVGYNPSAAALLWRACRWAVSEVPEVEYVARVGDHVFVRVAALLSALSDLEKAILVRPDSDTGGRFPLYWGYFTGQDRPRDAEPMVDPEFVLCDTYVPYAYGAGVVISGDMVAYIARHGPLLQLFSRDDVSLGTWLAPVNVTHVHDTRFDTE